MSLAAVVIKHVFICSLVILYVNQNGPTVSNTFSYSI